MKGDGIDGCVSAFVYNSITPETSEKGDIFQDNFKYYNSCGVAD